jgi:ABC-2 type transport system ATP-binding protein
MYSLDIKNLSKTYPSFKLDDVSFSIPQGYIMGFIGENGAGKTTTIKSMLNVIKRDSGDIIIFGRNIDEDELAIKSDIGYVSGESYYPKKTIREITKVVKRFFTNWDDELYQSLLKRFNLNEKKRIDELSKGMQLKYLITVALSHHAKLLILDEPTSGLDPVARDDLLAVFQSIVENEEASILFSTHITSDVEKVADYVTFIKQGKIIESCTKDDLLDKYRLVNGTSDELSSIKDRLISYKTNVFGFNGLIKTENVDDKDTVKIGQPGLDDIMIYYANMEVKA